MINKVVSKKVIVPILVIGLISPITSAHAGSGSVSTSEYFSPNTVYWQLGNDTSGDVIRVKMNGKYSSSRISEIQSIWELYGKSVGMNFQDAYYDDDGYLDGSSYVSTNYPDPKFDWEDDNDDNVDEEVEVVTETPEDLDSSTNYYFKVDYWYDESSGTGKVYGTTHTSAESYTGEWNTADYETIKYMEYDLAKRETLPSASKSSKQKSSENISKQKNDKVDFMSFKKHKEGFQSLVKKRDGEKIEMLITPIKSKLEDYVRYNKKLINQLEDEKKCCNHHHI